LFRARLFQQQGFGLWNNDWYGGHHILGYSVLFPAVSAMLTPQLAAALAATATAALFEALARRHFGPRAWLGALLFGAATAISLYTGRLALAFGALPALGAVVALDRDRPLVAAGLALLSALCSPVARCLPPWPPRATRSPRCSPRCSRTAAPRPPCPASSPRPPGRA